MIEDDKFAQNMRRELWTEHFGGKDLGVLHDAQSDECFEFWKNTSRNNSEIHKAVFGAIPSDEIKNRQEFVEHMRNSYSLADLTAEDTERYTLLQNLQGRLVEFQLGFLEDENDLYNPMPTAAALCPRDVFS